MIKNRAEARRRKEKRKGFPHQGCCSLEFAIKFAPISIYDYQFDMFSTASANLSDEYEKLFSNSQDEQHKLGGYPSFTQADPRYDCPKNEEPYILLLQIDTDRTEAIDIMWGDCGIGNFFIRKSAL